MYEAFFRLRQRPFAAAARVERYFPGALVEQARKTIVRCIERAEGPALLIGPAGVGKTMLCQVLAQHFGSRFKTAVLSGGHFGGRRALLQAILFELGQPYRGLDEGELRLALIDFALARGAESQGLALLVDEAHALPPRLLEELRLITNLTSGGEQRVRLVLSGNRELEEMFASPKLDSFSQRLAARAYLGPLDREESIAYIRGQITACGGDPEGIFPADAAEGVYQATEGIPRLINQLCDHTLILACVAGQRVAQRRTIEDAWADLQQLPARWTEDRETAGAVESVVEFGQLDAEERPQAIRFQPRGGHPAPEVEQRLADSERLLGQLEDEFVPAGAIGPKDETDEEIVVTPERHPFRESFAEEEIVIDRYAALDGEIFAGCPIVTCAEGHALGQSLAAAARALDSSWTPTPPGDAKASLALNRVESFTSSFEIGAGEVVRPFVSESRPTPESRAPEGPSAGPTFAGDSRANRYAALADDPEDHDLIVIEDEPPTTSPRAPAQARRQEYRQLFAKLRHG